NAPTCGPRGLRPRRASHAEISPSPARSVPKPIATWCRSWRMIAEPMARRVGYSETNAEERRVCPLGVVGLDGTTTQGAVGLVRRPAYDRRRHPAIRARGAKLEAERIALEDRGNT